MESANIVGYNTKDVTAAKFYILGVPFEATDGTTDINKLASGFTGVSQEVLGDSFTAVAPQIQMPNAGGGYDIYYYLTDGYYATGEVDGGGDPVYAQKPGWCDFNGVIAGDDVAELDGLLTAGVAMWVKDVQNSEAFQTAGQVLNDSDLTVNAPANFTLRANAFPVVFNLNDTNKVVFAGLAGVSQNELGDVFTASAPQIQVPNVGGGYDIYYYLTDGYYATGEVDGGGDPVYAQKPGWCDFNGVIAGDDVAELDGNVPTGQGFWTKGVGSAFTITFKK